jgi:RNA polymerase primary sigma factor
MAPDNPKDTLQILELLKKAKAGDSRAENKLVIIYKPYVEFMVRSYSKKTEIKDDDDLRSYIFLGLLEGIRKFDPTRGAKFIYFAHTWMKKNIFLGEGVHRFIRVPVNQKIFYDDYVKEMNADEFNELEKIEEDVRKYLIIENTKTELFTDLVTVTNEDDEGEAKQIPENLIQTATITVFEEEEKAISLEVLKANIQKVLSAFTDKEIYIITHLYGLNGSPIMSSEQIAENLNVTKVNITFTKTRIIRMLRHNSLSNQILSGI